jgi:hypothetical protein
MGMIREIAREEGLLDAARNVDLFFHALALALADDEPSIVQNACRVGGEGVKNLTVEFGESGGAAGI